MEFSKTILRIIIFRQSVIFVFNALNILCNFFVIHSVNLHLCFFLVGIAVKFINYIKPKNFSSTKCCYLNIILIQILNFLIYMVESLSIIELYHDPKCSSELIKCTHSNLKKTLEILPT